LKREVGGETPVAQWFGKQCGVQAQIARDGECGQKKSGPGTPGPLGRVNACWLN